MKKLFTLVALACMAIAVNAKDITVYVFAENTPNLWYWGAADASADGYSWPGVALTETKEVKDKTFYYKTFADLAEDASLNIIVNYTGDDDKTEDITGVTSDIYLIYNGDKTYENVTEQYAGDEGGEEEAENLWAAVEDGSAFIKTGTWFANDSWVLLETQPEITHADGVWELTIPEGMGPLQWQGQFNIDTSLTAALDKTYNFSLTIETDKDAPSVTIKLTETDEKDDEGNTLVKHDSNFFFDDRHDITAGTPYEYAVEDKVLSQNDAHALSLFFDFGGCEAGTKVKISNIVFTENASDAINTVAVKAVNNGIMYNLAGQRVGENYKGVVIMNGKKMIKK